MGVKGALKAQSRRPWGGGGMAPAWNQNWGRGGEALQQRDRRGCAPRGPFLRRGFCKQKGERVAQQAGKDLVSYRGKEGRCIRHSSRKEPKAASLICQKRKERETTIV